VAHAREEAQQPREVRRGGGGKAAEEVEDERLRRGEGRAGGDEELEVGDCGGRVGLGFDQLQQAVDGRRRGIGLRRRHRDVTALAACGGVRAGGGAAVPYFTSDGVRAVGGD